MTERRAEEIALKIFKQELLKHGIDGSLTRDLGNVASGIKISTEEMKAFIEFLLPEILGTMLGRERCNITFGEMKKINRG